MVKHSCLSTLRALAETWQAFEVYSGTHIRSLGLTPAQFDIVATLGNTPGMSCRELGEKALITKGTLTGLLDRLEAKKLLKRQSSDADRRSVFVSLTPQSVRLFEKVFPAHVAHCQCGFSRLSATELDQLGVSLRRLRDAFREHHTAARKTA